MAGRRGRRWRQAFDLLIGQKMVEEEMVGGQQVLEKQVVVGEGQGAPGCRLLQGTWVQDSSSLELRRRRENTWTLSPFSLLFFAHL